MYRLDYKPTYQRKINPNPQPPNSEPKIMQRFTTRGILKSLFFAAAMFYLFFHAMHGKQGIYALMREQHRRVRLQEELTQVTKERQQLENKVSRLRDDSLDKDLLDEQSRRMLGDAHPDEVLVTQ